ncbi:MAG: choice-of-anchor D domain-containing protein [Myxococcales bacterium]|nr:choice-of-anchor D domain-containing protein [Myxococcales bacterium]
MSKQLAAVVMVLVAGSLQACSCGTQTNTRFPKIEVLDELGNSRSNVDFGQVQVNVTGTQAVRIRNGGAAVLTLNGVTFSNAHFGLGTTAPVSIAVGEEFQLPLTFTPTTPDLRETGTATIACDDPATPTVALNVAGTGVTAVATVVPAALAFGEVYVTETKAITVSLTNSGSNDLVVSDAHFTGTPASVTADLSTLVKTLKAGESASAVVTFAPTTADALGGSLDIVLPAELGTKSLALTGQGIQALPRLCVKWDDSPQEQCTDQAVTFLPVVAGSLCDGRLYPADGGASPCIGLDGGAAPYQRAGRLYFRNDGNTPVTYTLQFQSQVGTSCDGGSSIDWEFANAPGLPDGGTQASWMEGNVKVPASTMDPKPWETAPVALTYLARSGCREDAADQARVLWTRQGEPSGSSRPPQTLIVNLTGQSLLPRGVPQDITMMGTVPLTAEFYGAGNAGDAPLQARTVSLWQAEYLLDGGRGNVPYELCDSTSTGDCRFFNWAPDGGDPALRLPLTLAGTPNASVPTRVAMGRLEFGPAPDGGVSPQLNRQYFVFAVVDTSDPYLPQVISRISGVAR